MLGRPVIEPLILGGGPAGAAAAIVLAQGGVRPVVVERTRETADALCGGFLSWRTLETLARLGIAADALNPRRIARLRIMSGDRCRELALPHAAVGVSRRRLDTLMLAAAVRAGAAVERGVAVRAVEQGTVRTGDGACLAPRTLILATGKHDLRGLVRPAPRVADPAIGLRVRLGPAAALDRLVGDAIELHLFDGGYAGVVMQEDGTANLCLAVRRSRLEGREPDALLARLGAAHPALGERLAWRAGAIDAVANVPYGWRATEGRDGLFRLGDQAAVIPSLAGEGVGIAVASGISAAQAVLAGRDGAGWQRDFAAATRAPVALAGAVRAVAERPRAAAALLPLMPDRLIRRLAKGTRIARAA